MNLRELMPKGKISDDIMQSLSPVFKGEILCKQGKYEQAEAKYLEGLENFPSRSGGRFLIYNKLGILYEKLEEHEQAIEVYEKAVEEGTVTPYTYERVGRLLLYTGRLSESLEYCEKGIRTLRLKKSRINLFQEVYFRFLFLRLKRKIKRHSAKSEEQSGATPGR